MSQQLLSVPPHDWANSSSADVFLAVVSMVLVLWEFVLFYGMGVEFKGEVLSNYTTRGNDRRVSLQEMDLACIMFWIDHVILSQWCGGWQSKMVVKWLGIVAQSGSVGLGFPVEIL